MAHPVTEAMKKADNTTIRTALSGILEAAVTPAFGALPKREIELLLLDALIAIGYIEESPELYTLIRKLRMTKSRARALLYERELRRLDSARLDEMVQQALRKPLLQKQGEVFCIEVENPLVADHIRALLKQLGHSTDGSFSPSLIRISLSAAAALIEHFIEKPDRAAIKKALVDAGAPDKSLQGAIVGVLKQVASKAAGRVGEALVGEAAGYVAPLLGGAKDVIIDKCKALFTAGG